MKTSKMQPNNFLPSLHYAFAFDHFLPFPVSSHLHYFVFCRSRELPSVIPPLPSFILLLPSSSSSFPTSQKYSYFGGLTPQKRCINFATLRFGVIIEHHVDVLRGELRFCLRFTSTSWYLSSSSHPSLAAAFLECFHQVVCVHSTYIR